MAKHNELGQTGENLAVRYLEDQDYIILERNCRQRHWEMDIVAIKGNVIAFVEVKTRTSESYGQAEAAVDMKKQRRMMAMADRYVCQHNRAEYPRMDIIAVVKEGTEYVIRHTPNAFGLMG